MPEIDPRPPSGGRPRRQRKRARVRVRGGRPRRLPEKAPTLLLGGRPRRLWKRPTCVHSVTVTGGRRAGSWHWPNSTSRSASFVRLKGRKLAPSRGREHGRPGTRASGNVGSRAAGALTWPIGRASANPEGAATGAAVAEPVQGKAGGEAPGGEAAAGAVTTGTGVTGTAKGVTAEAAARDIATAVLAGATAAARSGGGATGSSVAVAGCACGADLASATTVRSPATHAASRAGSREVAAAGPTALVAPTSAESRETAGSSLAPTSVATSLAAAADRAAMSRSSPPLGKIPAYESPRKGPRAGAKANPVVPSATASTVKSNCSSSAERLRVGLRAPKAEGTRPSDGGVLAPGMTEGARPGVGGA